MTLSWTRLHGVISLISSNQEVVSFLLIFKNVMTLPMKCCVTKVDVHFLPFKPLSLGAKGDKVGYTSERETELPKNNHFRRDIRILRLFVSHGTRNQNKLLSLNLNGMDFEKPEWTLLLHISMSLSLPGGKLKFKIFSLPNEKFGIF